MIAPILRRVLGGVGLALAVLTAAQVAHADSTPALKLAVRPDEETPAGVEAFNDWLGRPADYILVFQGFKSWTDYTGSIEHFFRAYEGFDTPKIWSIGLNVTGTTLKQAASGAFDGHYAKAARELAAGSPADQPILVRPGHEFNIAGQYPWEVIQSGDWSDYRAAFQRLVRAFRKVSPRFRFIWNPNWTSSSKPQFDVEQAYPGDAYVDYVGLDHYLSAQYSDADPNVAFSYARNLTYGFAWQVAFAHAHGKLPCLTEFGLDRDEPAWVDLMHGWLVDNGYAFAGYWNANAAFSSKLSDGSYPNSGERFIADFGSPPQPLLQMTFADGPAGLRVEGGARLDVANGVAQISGSSPADRVERALTGLEPGTAYRLDLDVADAGPAAAIRVLRADTYATLASLAGPAASGPVRLDFTPDTPDVVLQIIPGTVPDKMTRLNGIRLYKVRGW